MHCQNTNTASYEKSALLKGAAKNYKPTHQSQASRKSRGLFIYYCGVPYYPCDGFVSATLTRPSSLES